MNFPNIQSSWNIIGHRPVRCSNESNEAEAFSLKGRGGCLMHTLATPLKALSGLGRLVLSVVAIAHGVFAVLTLNAPPKHLLKIPGKVIDIVIGAALLPVALLANVIRGVVGTIFHPGAMIKKFPFAEGTPFYLAHNILHGTLVNY